MKRRRLLPKILLATAATALLLEGALQVLAYVNWHNERSTRSGGFVRRTDSTVVLCVGDSFTFGMGASAPELSYPGQLEKLLESASGSRWQVVNRGWPGNDSFEVRSQIGQLLDEVRPDVVCVVVGINDRWRQRGRSADAVDADAFAWKLRTLELFRILVRGRGLFESANDGPLPRSRPAAAPAGDYADHPLAGRWSIEGSGVPVTFGADGVLVIGGARLAWRPDGDGFVLDLAGVEQGVAIEKDKDSVTLSLPTARVRLTRAAAAGASAPRSGAEQRFWQACGIERWSEAIALGTRIRDGGTRSEILRIAPQLVAAARKGGDDGAADETLAVARELHAAAPDAAATDCLARCLERAGGYAEGFELTRAWIEGGRPFSPGIVEQHVVLASLALSRAEVLAVAEAAAAQLRGHPERCARVWTIWCRLYAGDDHALLAKGLLAIWRLAPESWMAERVFGKHGGAVPKATLEEVARTEGLSDERARAFAARVHGSIPDGDADWAQTLALHLEEVAAICREAGARVVLGTYPPQKDTTANDTLRAIARRLELPLADVGPRLPRSMQERRAYLVADGHCNDRGYAEMAAAFAEAVTSAMRAR